MPKSKCQKKGFEGFLKKGSRSQVVEDFLQKGSRGPGFKESRVYFLRFLLDPTTT